MNRSSMLILLLMLAAVSLPIAWSARRLQQANGQLDQAQANLMLVLSDVQEVIDLRSRQQLVSVAERPTQDVIAQINAVLAEAGIPSNRLKSLTPESDAALNPAKGAGSIADGHRRQALRLTLENLTVQELGMFLMQWRSAQQIWTPVRIELTHARSQKSSAPENRYDATILISAIYIDQAAKPQLASTSTNPS